MSSNVKLLSVAAFAIADIVLIAWLFTRDPAPATDSEPSTGKTSQATVRPPVDESVRLSIGESFTLFRIHPSDCSDESIPMLEISSNAAQKFREVGLPVQEDGDPAIRSVLAVDAKSDDELSLLATNRDCKRRGFVSDDGGESWKRGDVSFGWFIGPDGKSVTSPSRTSSPNCGLIALDYTGDANAKVVCKSDSLLATSDGGATWAVAGKLTGIRTVAFVGQKTGLAIAARKNCESRSFRSNDAGASWKAAACIDKKAEVRALVGGAARMYATDGSRTWRTDDLGDEWSEVEPQG